MIRCWRTRPGRYQRYDWHLGQLPEDLWRADEDRHFAADRTEERADLVVDGDSSVPHDPATEFVVLNDRRS